MKHIPPRWLVPLVLITLTVGSKTWAQSFTPVPSGSAGNLMLPSGYITPSGGGSSTALFQGHAATFDLYGSALQYWDARAWFRASPGPSEVPAGWVTGGGSMSQCDPRQGDLGGISVQDLVTYAWTTQSWGTYCNMIFYPNFVMVSAVHPIGNPNGPIMRPSLPAEAPPACIHGCGGK